MDWAPQTDRMKDVFALVRDSILQVAPGLWWSWYHSANDFFPLRAFLSFGRSGEELAFCANFWRHEGQLVFSSDVSYTEGRIIADGPGSVVCEDAATPLWADSQCSLAGEFFMSQVDVVLALLAN